MSSALAVQNSTVLIQKLPCPSPGFSVFRGESIERHTGLSMCANSPGGQWHPGSILEQDCKVALHSLYEVALRVTVESDLLRRPAMLQLEVGNAVYFESIRPSCIEDEDALRAPDILSCYLKISTSSSCAAHSEGPNNGRRRELSPLSFLIYTYHESPTASHSSASVGCPTVLLSQLPASGAAHLSWLSPSP